jgi:hypothetical protein
MFPFNITNPGIYIEGLLTSQEASFVTNLVGLSPNDGDTFIYDTGTGLWTVGPGGGGGVTDGDKGDITVSGGGATWTIDSNAVTTGKIADSNVTLAKIENIATAHFLGRHTGGSGAVQQVSATQARSILNVADGATANSSDATLLARANHTGTQLASTISDFAAAVAATAAVVANTAKVTNATHTGEVTGSGVLTVDKTAITNKTLVTAALGDQILVADASDTDNLKRVTVQTIVDLAVVGGGITDAQAKVIARRYAIAL